MDTSLESQIKHFYEVERLSIRQIAEKLKISRKRASRIIRNEKITKPPVATIIKPYERLIACWYKEHPYLKATQIHERLKSYGYPGSYTTLSIYTQKYRTKRLMAYHELESLPGEEAQIDWMVVTELPFGPVYGFVFILSYSRYLYLRFYPRQSLEFFLDGHIESYKEISGVAHKNRYDNLKSVVISAKPELRFNSQFLDFARHYGFSIHPCNPYRANEKGKVERAIRDIRDFIRADTFYDIADLNKKANLWRNERNSKIHRSTSNTPRDLLKEEKLLSLPRIHYRPYRVILASTTKTGFVEFETNRYSVPSSYPGASCEIFAYPDTIEIMIKGKRVAVHKRSFERKQKIENPAHREKLINITPNFKYKRIYQLMKNMDPAMTHFIDNAEDEGQDSIATAYELFRLLKSVSKGMLLSAIRQANDTGCHKLKYINSLLQLPEPRDDNPVYPQNTRLLDINYQGRELKEYDELI